MQVTLQDIYDFYQVYPEYKGEIEVETRHGYYPIDACDYTAYDSEVYKVSSRDSDKELFTSPEHRLWTKNGWEYVKDINSDIETNDGYEKFDIVKQNYTEDLMDIQVREVHEFYANGVVSHNSSCIEAIHFALYGKPFRKIVKNQLVNNINKKNLLVELDFTIGNKDYKIERGISPNIFNIYCDGNKLDNDSSALDFQKELEFNILKMSKETFRQIIVLGSTSYIPFMRLNNSNRNLIVEDLLDIQIFSKMLVVLKQQISQSRRNLTDINHSIELAQNSKDLTENHIEKIKLNNKKITSDNDEAKKELNEKISNLESGKEKLNQIMIKNALDEDKLTELVNLKKQIKESNQSLTIKISELDKTYDFFTLNDNCPTCSQTISEYTKEESQAYIDQKRNSFISKLNKNKQHSDHAQEEIAEMRLHFDKLKKINEEIKSINNKITIEKRLLKNLSKAKEMSFDDSYEKLNSINEKLNTLVKDQQELLKLLEEYFFISEILNENGIKSSIIKTYLPIINKIIKKYLQILEFDIKFEFDETFNECIQIAGRDDVQYYGLSEGQKLRIDLCLLFTFRDVSKLKNSTSSNLLIFDEIGDSSLDHEGFEAFLRILKEDATKGSNIFVISHSSSMQNDDVLDTSMEFRKDSLFTELI